VDTHSCRPQLIVPPEYPRTHNTYKMARKSKSLIRYIFRHGPHARERANTTPSKLSQIPNTPETDSPPRRATADDAPESPLAYKTRSESRQSTNLEAIVEETDDAGQDTNDAGQDTDDAGQDTDGSSSHNDDASIAETLAALDLDLNTFTTRGLITASVAEARMGNDAHLVTIDTTLALLDALDGFSATIAVLKTEMEDKKRVCEEKLSMLEDVERAVSRMQFGEEEAEDSDMAG
jgi:hypothetical protein